LVLDEPTSGLDPSGRKEVRELLLALKNAGKTIFLSSHLLSEVEQLSDEAVIIDRGRVLRAGAMKELLETGNQVEVVATEINEELATLLRELGATVERSSQGVRIIVGSERTRELLERLWLQGSDVVRLNPVKGSLEDLYMKLVGKNDAA
jgi:ABC-2 type transport system ATP-binding protein